MSSLIRRIQAGSGNYAGLLTSQRARWGSKLGVHNEEAVDLQARLARHTIRGSVGISRPPRALRRSKKSQAWLKERAEVRKAKQS